MKASTFGTLVIRGNGVAMLIVATKAAFDLAYVYCAPAYHAQIATAGPPHYALTAIAFEYAIAFLLFWFSRRLGRLLSRGFPDSSRISNDANSDNNPNA